MDNDNNTWPMLLDMTKEECRQNLRALELSTYSKIVSVLRAQGELTKEKRKLLFELQSVFSIPIERHRAEVRRAVNDEILNTVAERLAGPNTGVEWAIEGRRLIPLMPRVPPQVAYTALATRMAQVYCGISSKMPKPCLTPMYGKLFDLGAESEETDSEEETDGLPYLPGSMIPPCFNSDEGSYTVLPHSQHHLKMEKLKEKEAKRKEKESESKKKTNESKKKTSETKKKTFQNDDSSSSDDQPLSPPSPPHPLVGAEKRKRKRSFSTDHAPAHPPPPAPAPAQIAPGVTQASALLGTHRVQNTIAPLRQVPSIGSNFGGQSMKITVTGGITRSSTMTSTSINNHSPKVILVSTSSASGQGGGVYQRSVSVPILKPSLPHSVSTSSIIGGGLGGVTASGILRGAVPSVSMSTSSSVLGASFVGKARPRFASMSSSILSQSSLSGLSPRPSRPLTNSIVIHGDGSSSPFIGASTGRSEVFIPTAVLPDSSSGNSVNLYSGVSGGSVQSSIHLRQDGNKVFAASAVRPSAVSNVVAGRIIGRTTSFPSSNQGLYVMPTTSGTITVVTRTVASECVTTPRVVTVNPNGPKPSIIRAPSPATIVSTIPGAISGAFPGTIPGAKSNNIIVVHKGSAPPGIRPLSLQGMRDISTKIITKSLSPSISSTPQNVIAGTALVKPPVKPLSAVATSSTKDPNSVSVSSTIISSSYNSASSDVTAGHSNMIVVDFNNQNQRSVSSISSTMANSPNISEATFSGQNASTFEREGKLQEESIEERTTEASLCESSINAYTTEASLCESSVNASTTEASLCQSSVNASTTEASTLSSSFSLEGNDSLSGELGVLPENTELPSSSNNGDVEMKDVGPSSAKVITPTNQITSTTSDIQNYPNEMIEQDPQPSSSSYPQIGGSNEDDVWFNDDPDVKIEDLLATGNEETLNTNAGDLDEFNRTTSSEVETEENQDEYIPQASTSKIQTEEEQFEQLAVAKIDRGIEQLKRDERETMRPRDERETMRPRDERETMTPESTSSTKGGSKEDAQQSELQTLVEQAVEVLKEGDCSQARNLLFKAGFELIDSTNDCGGDSFAISSLATNEGVSSSSLEGGLGEELSQSLETDGREFHPAGDSSPNEPTTYKADSLSEEASIDDDSK